MLEIRDLVFIPVSALNGDNIVTHSEKMPWYQGTTLLHHLENVNVGADRNLIDFRYPVQFVNRPNLDFRGFCGTIASGRIRKGETVMSLPSRKTSRPPHSLSVTLSSRPWHKRVRSPQTPTASRTLRGRRTLPGPAVRARG